MSTSVRTFRVLNFGVGVQSSKVLMASCEGLLPKLDAAVFGDPQWESQETYQHYAVMKRIAESAGIPVITVTSGNLREHTLTYFVHGRAKGDPSYGTMPLYLLNKNGKRGMIRRKCTHRYKILAVERWIKQHLLGLKARQRVPSGVLVERWYGISVDEASRMRDAGVSWQMNVYPLCNFRGHGHEQYYPHPVSRKGCSLYLEARGIACPKSACLGCPFRSNAMWREVRKNPIYWRDVCEMDDAIRRPKGMRSECFLHAARIPLREVDIDTDNGPDFFDNECQGVCGV